MQSLEGAASQIEISWDILFLFIADTDTEKIRFSSYFCYEFGQMVRRQPLVRESFCESGEGVRAQKADLLKEFFSGRPRAGDNFISPQKISQDWFGTQRLTYGVVSEGVLKVFFSFFSVENSQKFVLLRQERVRKFCGKLVEI